MDIGSIQAAIGGLQAAGDIAKSMIGLHDATVLKTKTIELQSAILAAQSSALSAQSEQFALVDRIRELEEEIRRMEAWDAEKQRYELTDIGNGQFTYSLKEGMQPPEPPHSICANCYNQGQKSILQGSSKMGRKSLICNRCKAEIVTRESTARKGSPRVDLGRFRP